VIVVIPEAWKAIPQGRSSPVKLITEHLIREGGAIGIWVWLDSQDVAGVDKKPLKSVDNWLLGKQREINEVIRTIDQIPLPRSEKPKPEEVMSLKLGHFIVATSEGVKHCYVQPSWLDPEVAKRVALGELSVEEAKRFARAPLEVDRLKAEVAKLKGELAKRDEEIARLKAQLETPKMVSDVMEGRIPAGEREQIIQEVMRRMQATAPRAQLPSVVETLGSDAKQAWILLREKGPLFKVAIRSAFRWGRLRTDKAVRELMRRRLVRLDGKKLYAQEPLI